MLFSPKDASQGPRLRFGILRSGFPSLLSILGLLYGFTALTCLFEGELSRACLYLATAVVIDGLDGLAARKLDASSEFGAQLDSMCDLFNFGIVPSLMAYVCLQELSPESKALSILAPFAYLLACIFRLIRFNLDSLSDSEEASQPANFFVGLPSPGAASFVCSACLVLGSSSLGNPASYIKQQALLSEPARAQLVLVIYVIAALLMASRLQFPDFRRSSFLKTAMPLLFVSLSAANFNGYLPLALFGLSFGYCLSPLFLFYRFPEIEKEFLEQRHN